MSKKRKSKKYVKTAKKKKICVMKRSYNTYTESSGGVLIPRHMQEPVKPGKLLSGIKGAELQFRKILDELSSTSTDNFRLSDVEMTVSFDASGRFLGIGVGGATHIKIKYIPK